ncbi:MAG TPA: alpha-L-arabinofuranosidase, partial [Isoptericola sp.]|nr:alpha-L-arabinofuranosidase [Isoptericola sp.]
GAALGLVEGWQMVADHEPAVEGPEHAAKVAETCWSTVDVASVATAGDSGTTRVRLAPESWTAFAGTFARA